MRHSPTGGAASPNATGGTAAITPMPTFIKQTIEALALARRQYIAHNAMSVVQVMDHAPALQEALAGLYEHLGKQSIEMVDLPPSTAQFFATLGQQQRQTCGALRTGMAACRKAVSEQVARIQRQNPKETRWDNKENRPGSY